MFLRTGLFTNPTNRARFIGELRGSFNDALAAFYNSGILTPDGLHVWAVLNVGFFQADAAYVSVDTFDELVLSVAIRFK